MKISELKNKIKIGQVLYPVILVIFFIFVFLVLYRVINFSRSIINGLFLTNESISEQVLRVSMNDFRFVMNKFGVTIEKSPELTSVVETTPADSAVIVDTSTEIVASTNLNEQSEENLVNTSTAGSFFDKNQVSIIVYNASGKTGEAGRLAAQIKVLGFNSTTAQNFKSNFPATKIIYKESLKNQLGELEQLIKRSYPSATEEFAATSTAADVEIFIGKN